MKKLIASLGLLSLLILAKAHGQSGKIDFTLSDGTVCSALNSKRSRPGEFKIICKLKGDYKTAPICTLNFKDFKHPKELATGKITNPRLNKYDEAVLPPGKLRGTIKIPTKVAKAMNAIKFSEKEKWLPLAQEYCNEIKANLAIFDQSATDDFLEKQARDIASKKGGKP